MPYNPKLKANSDIFTKLQLIEVGQQFILRPIVPELLDEEAIFYVRNSKSEGVKRFLPSVFADNTKDAKVKLKNFIERTLHKASILYCIGPKQQQFPIGYIHLNSPLTETGLETWTIDFWLGEAFQGKGILSASLKCLLKYLEGMELPEICASVDPENTKSIKALMKAGFEYEMVEKSGAGKHLYTVTFN